VYIFGQILGIVITIMCLIGPFYKKKWMMLVNSGTATLLASINLLLIGAGLSSIIVNIVALPQIFVSLYHVLKGTKVKKWENVLFMFLFIGCGLFSYFTDPNFVFEISLRNFIELLPTGAAAFFCIGTFTRDEQKTRKWGIANNTLWLVYYASVLSTTAFAQVFSLIANVSALITYRKKKEK
jgi:hypothetical protein